MQAIFTFVIEVFTVSSFVLFSIAFITGFIQYERDRSIATVAPAELPAPTLKDVVIPFQRPHRKPTCEPINWQLWGIRDLRRASQRTAFGVPVELEGKSLTKPQFVALYEQALLEEVAIAVDAA